MNRSHVHHRSGSYSSAARNAAIDWDLSLLAEQAVPMSLQHTTMSRPQDVADFNCAWGVTMPADLVALPQPTPFHETILGLVTREVTEPDVFAHFFGQ